MNKFEKIGEILSYILIGIIYLIITSISLYFVYKIFSGVFYLLNKLIDKI